MPDDPSFNAWFDAQRAAVDRAISEHLKLLNTPHSRLGDAVRYAMTNGGKRLRPILVLECCRTLGGREAEAWPAAIAIECVHAFSLVHDDLPAMDDDDLRRGKPTTHKAFDEATAVLAGDWLLAHAFGGLSHPAEVLPGSELSRGRDERRMNGRIAALVRELSIGTVGMIIGQSADIEGEGRPPDADMMQYIHGHKTGDLIEAACRMGAVCADGDAEQVRDMARYGRHLGHAFQIADDLLDATGDESATGKRVGKDAAAAKQTYPAVFGVEKSRAAAGRELASALAVLDNLGPVAANLRGLARFVVRRDR